MAKVIIHTNLGDITIRMHDDMPITTGNFMKLAKEGFYDDVIFHRVIKDFMIQGGDPDGTGMGGPGYTIEDEFGKGHSNVRGTISMANTGRPHTGGSQFFINTIDNKYLDKENPTTPYAHPVFGQVVSGMDVVDIIGNLPVDMNDKPTKPAFIKTVEVIERSCMGKHVMECLGMSRVVIEDEKIIDISEPEIKYCPLFKKYRNIDELSVESIRKNIEYRMKTFGMCCENRETRMKDFLSFGISEILSSAVRNKYLDAAVIAADGCGTVILTDPELIQGLGGRISGLCETSPIKKVIDDVGSENVLDPINTPLDSIAGVRKAKAKGHKMIGVTVASAKDAQELRKTYGNNLVIIAVHTSKKTEEETKILFDNCDIITACASYACRMESKKRDVIIAGNKVPVYGVTEKGKELVNMRLEEVGKEAWNGNPPEEPPYPLI